MKTRLIISILAIVAPALWLKKTYGAASGKELDWILAPTAALINMVTDLHFVRESGLGWIDPTHNAVIAPSCAGINFLIVAFCAVGLRGVWSFRSPIAQLGWVAAALPAVFAATLMVNTLRIRLLIELHHLDIYGARFTPELAHLIGGVIIYYGSLLCLFWWVSVILKRRAPVANATGWAPPPWAWWLVPPAGYLLITLVAPLVTGNFLSDVAAFTRHATTVVLLSVALSLPGLVVTLIPRSTKGA